MNVQHWPEKGYYRITWPARFSAMEIPAPIFSNGHGGFNGFIVLNCPLRPKNDKCDITNKYNWVWSGFTVKSRKYANFLGRCEFLGTEFPWWLLVTKEKKISMQYQEVLFK